LRIALQHDGLTRSYDVHVPAKAVGASNVPVVMVLHGGSGDGPSMRQMSLMDAYADYYGFISVYPNGTPMTPMLSDALVWNALQADAEVDGLEDVDDIGFFVKMIEDLVQRFKIDRRRVYVTGLSNGAMMAYALACRLSDRITAIAPVGAIGAVDQCPLTRRVPVLHLHGLDDPCAPYAGGTSQSCVALIFNEFFGLDLPINERTTESVPAYVNRWAQMEQISTKAQSYVPYNKVSCVKRATSKPTAAEVTYCSMRNTGHTWPGGTWGPICNTPNKLCTSFQEISGALSPDIPGNQLILEFFAKYSL
jgi:polyhydroxybutyrate depolymerase